jgi:hypothetical protein
LAALIHTVFWTVSRIDPLVYMNFEAVDMKMGADPTWLLRLTMLAVLAAGYGVAAVAQWRRVEA